MSTNTPKPSFEVGAYIGISVEQLQAQIKITHEILKTVGADKDPSWIEFRSNIESGNILDVMTQELTLKHVRVIACPAQEEGEEDFVEIQISKEAMQAYAEYCTEMSKVCIVVINMIKSIIDVLDLSGIDKASKKFAKVFFQSK